MKEETISVTTAARRFAECINRVRYQGTSFLLHKNGVPVARIVSAHNPISADIEQRPTTPLEAREEVHSDQEMPIPIHSPKEIGKASQATNLARRPTLNW